MHVFQGGGEGEALLDGGVYTEEVHVDRHRGSVLFSSVIVL